MSWKTRSILHCVLSAAALWLLVAPCRGQARYAGTGPGPLITVGGTASGYNIDYGKRDLGGIGIYADFAATAHLGIEGEARFLRYNQEADTHLSTYLVGPRVAFGTHRLIPYGKFLVGLGKFNFPYDYATGSYFVLAPGAGVDYKLNQRIKLRLIDVEYQEWPQFTYGSIHPYGISAGISFTILHSDTKLGRR
jgi:opacity protein-like surface antigen